MLENPPDIEMNPLMTGIADLSISPSGNPRKSLTGALLITLR